MNKDQVKGRITEAEGKAKEVTGKVVGNKNLEKKGNLEKAVGEIQANKGDRKQEQKEHR